ncbi:MAG: ABC transporter permease [Propionicimonas sp.]|uniref:ABC transporter permease n=1 Tax=Propionicimonas sp. TaxID=1955623 RepID=UPI001DDEDDF1|nr:ABC transporter permease [Propionicimonas sp.]MBU4188776.1 ABC transporter permease [Actinomycetota bacterium]MBU4207595.1 ABC transporter permease [Actinomycetota bacterium]MBU4249201.1 ABC transporter permease [Actinomycetota bacterium]MBU4363038.1 ABC transporter permease [Actinomycetota bacterium]MBU4410752.1 ABC transporter permease [Actinomycetota bacterium]
MLTQTPTPAPRKHWLRLPHWRFAARRLRGALALGLALLALIVLATIFVPMISPYTATEIAGKPLMPPSLAHLFGTDTAGRDVFVRTWVGGRNDLLMVVLVVVASSAIGTLVGVVASMSSQLTDSILMRLTDALISFPGMIIVMAIALVFSGVGEVGPFPRGALPAVIAIVAINWASYTRLVRGEALSLRSRDFITAATLLGYSKTRIIIRHLLPNLATTVVAYMVVDAIVAVVTIAGMPFIGAGIQPPAPEWGSLMLAGSTVLYSAWWVTVMPGLVVTVYGIALSLIADSLLAEVDGGAR